MNKQAKIMFLIIMLLMIVVLCIQFSYAWFSKIDKSAPIIVETGTLRLKTTFYRGLDENFDGVLDDNQYEEINSAGIRFYQCTAGQTYTFKVVFTNEGSVDGLLNFSINNVYSNILDTLKSFKVEFINPTTTLASVISLNNHTNGTIKLFEDFRIGNKYKTNNALEFYFTIQVLGTLSNSSRNDVVTIENFLARVVQYH